MVRAHVADGGDGLQTLMTAANRDGPSAWRLLRGNNPTSYLYEMLDGFRIHLSCRCCSVKVVASPIKSRTALLPLSKIYEQLQAYTASYWRTPFRWFLFIMNVVVVVMMMIKVAVRSKA
jgi:hypothetical protein